jgi:hypothetical protein
MQWIPGAASLGVNLPGHKTDRSAPPSTEVKECMELYFHYPTTPSFTFTFTLNVFDKHTRLLICQPLTQNLLPLPYNRFLGQDTGYIGVYACLVLFIDLFNGDLSTS